MRADSRLKLDTGERAFAFSLEHPDANPTLTAAVGQLGTLITRARTLAQQQRTGILEVGDAVLNKRALRRAIRADLSDLVRIAEVAALRQPEQAVRLVLPGTSAGQRPFVSTARAMIARATASRDMLLGYGMPEDLLASLSQALDRYESTTSDKASGTATHVGASAELAEVADQVMQVVQHLDALNRRRFRGNAELLAAWKSARNVHWRRAEKEGGETGIGSAA